MEQASHSGVETRDSPLNAINAFVHGPQTHEYSTTESDDLNSDTFSSIASDPGADADAESQHQHETNEDFLISEVKTESLKPSLAMADDKRMLEFESESTHGREVTRSMSKVHGMNDQLHHKTTISDPQDLATTAMMSGALPNGEPVKARDGENVAAENNALDPGVSEADRNLFTFGSEQSVSLDATQSLAGDAKGGIPASLPESDHARQAASPLLIEKILQAVKPAEKVCANSAFV